MTDERGRLLAHPTGAPAPLLVVGACSAGICWATATGVPEALHARLATALAGEPTSVAIGWSPGCADLLDDALTEVCDLDQPHGGPSYVVPRGLVAPNGIDLRSSDQIDSAALHGLMPEADRSLTAPWVVAMVVGRVAAVCETARTAPTSVEAGVWTYEPYRRRGLGTAVTAAWSALVTDRTAFYSTSWDNAASQGVARRLGLRAFAHWWQLSRSGVGGTD